MRGVYYRAAALSQCYAVALWRRRRGERSKRGWEAPGLCRNLLHMKLIKSLTVFACAFALLAGSVRAADDAPKKDANLPACCAKAKKAGKECTHKCCQAAAKDGKTCEKCGSKKTKKTA
jgi:hypothetical protein